MKQDKIICPFCGEKLNKEMVFCPHCGRQLSVDDEKDIPQNIMVRAKKVNGSMKKPGDWESRTWEVYYDRMYSITAVDIPEYKRERKIFPWRKNEKNDNSVHEIWNTMDQKSFDELKTAADAVPWSTLEIRESGYDADGWEIEYFSEDGVLVGSAGEGRLVEIMGNTNLLQVVGRIPEMTF